MLDGLNRLTLDELTAFAKEAETYSEGDDHKLVVRKLLDWMGSVSGAGDREPSVIERRCLKWLSERLELSAPDSASVDELEAGVRRKIAEESYEFLFPFLEVGSSIAYIGPKQVVGPKLELLEASSASLIPSHSARDRMKVYWKERGALLLAKQGELTIEDLMDYLEIPILLLKEQSEQTRISVLILSYVVALSDGRFEQPEEHFTAALAKKLDIDPTKADQAQREVSQIFWKKMTELGGGTYQPRNTEEELSLNLKAAQLTLESSGSLASFSDEVEKGFVASLHRSMESGSAIKRGMKSWDKTPFRFPLGFATGMLCYIKERWSVDSHEILMRLCLAAIFRQHLEATGDNAEITSERIEEYLPERVVENVADTLAETAIGKDKIESTRRISLEPLKFPDNL